MDNKKRDNQTWLIELQKSSSEFNNAVESLRKIIFMSLKKSFYKVGVENLEDFTQESIIKILYKMDTYKGKSSFTTWSVKIAVNHTITELRRRSWKDVSINSLESPENMIAKGSLFRIFDSPEKRMMKKEMLMMMNNIIDNELTNQQRKVMEALMIHGMPLEEVAVKLDVNRNALYKTIHDARKRIKKILIEKKITIEEILGLF